MFITDFFYQYDWVTWQVQFGPIILTWAILLIAAAFERKESNEENEVKKKPKISGSNHFTLFIVFVALVIISLNIIVGEPNMSITNMYNPEFWILIVLLPLLSQFHFKKKTDGVY